MTEIRGAWAYFVEYEDGTTNGKITDGDVLVEIRRTVKGKLFVRDLQFPRSCLDPTSEVRKPGDRGTLRYDMGDSGDVLKRPVLRWIAAEVRHWLENGIDSPKNRKDYSSS